MASHRGEPELEESRRNSLGRKLAWFAALWAAGVGVVGIVALILRAWIGTG